MSITMFANQVLRPTLGLVFALGMFLSSGIEGVANEPITEGKISKSSAKSVEREAILKVSKEIDSLVKANLVKSGEKMNEMTSDEVFLRRAYLDIIGRIPTIDETKDFLRSKSKDKRADLIDRLLDSYGYVSRQYNFWADVLRVQSRLPGQLNGIGYIDFIKDSLEENKPYDQFVRELLTAEGPNLERGNGAVGYYLRDRNMPEDNMSNTVRIFLGTRLECAQCHDHPFDKWTQRQYFEMVAFTGGLRYRHDDIPKSIQQIRTMVRKGEIPRTAQGVVNRLSQNVNYGIAGDGTGLARLPEGFLGEDGYEGEIVVGKTMFEGKNLVGAKVPKVNPKAKGRKPKKGAQQGYIPGAKDLDSRKAYAEWMTDPQNPRFAKVIANRLWKQALGIALIEPLDIIEDNTVASNPELMEFLTETMIDLNFDTKQFLRAIYNSDVYQAAAFDSDVNDVTKFNFNGPIVRRMSAEQIWDSLLTLTVEKTDTRSEQADVGRQYSYLGNNAYERFEKLMKMDAGEIKDAIAKSSDKSMMSKKKSNYKDSPEYKKMVAKQKQLKKQLQAANRSKNTAQIRKIKIEQAKVVSEYRGKARKSNYLRASEMPSPARPGHFLREFGQSDREQIDGSNTDPAVTQVLSMMNGYVEQSIAKDKASVLVQTALTAKSGKECVDLIFLSMLNRKPKSSESREWIRDLEAAVKAKDEETKYQVFGDLIWTLANSNEFVFVK